MLYKGGRVWETVPLKCYNVRLLIVSMRIVCGRGSLKHIGGGRCGDNEAVGA